MPDPVSDPATALPDRLTARPSPPLSGCFATPGDKSMSHRALILGALSIGETRITGLLESDDILRTAAAVGSMGAVLHRAQSGAWTVRGAGVGGLSAPADILDFGNSGTGVRLMMGVLAGYDFPVFVTGDSSLRSRPMERVIAPLRLMGLDADLQEGGRLPARLRGAAPPLPIRYTVPVPSAQVKSAILLAGLHAPGATTVIEPVATRDHTERMLTAFGARLESAPSADGGRAITVAGDAELVGTAVAVPGDPSSAAFGLVAGLIVGGSRVEVTNVMLNPGRSGLLTTLEEMGATVTRQREVVAGGEPVCDLAVTAGPLQAVTVPAERAPSMIDEYPILAVAAAFAEGTTRLEGLAELRVKESDRLSATAAGLQACGVCVTVEDDTLIVEGRGPEGVPGGGHVAAGGDHRIAMAFLVLGLAAQAPVSVSGCAMIATSFPSFLDRMGGIGALVGESDW
ncbi:MAG: 3-phosphoshikimate 1-carboxyvinyltransferase [Alphaproteobacteria bacterium]